VIGDSSIFDTAVGDTGSPRPEGGRGAPVCSSSCRSPSDTWSTGPRAHASAPGADGGRGVPRLGAAGRRTRQVHPEGGRRPCRRGSRGLLAGRRGGGADLPTSSRSSRSRSGHAFYALDLDVGVFFVLAMSSVGVIGDLRMAGWASANKFSLIGALRAAAQLIAYELPLVLVSAAVVLQAGSMSLLQITEAPVALLERRLPWQLVGFVIFMMAAVAELTRPPSTCRSRTPRSSSARTRIHGVEVRLLPAVRIRRHRVMSAVASVLYLAGTSRFRLGVIPGIFWTFGKIFALSFVIIWLRATFPRLREDQLQRFAWVGLTPLRSR